MLICSQPSAICGFERIASSEHLLSRQSNVTLALTIGGIQNTDACKLGCAAIDQFILILLPKRLSPNKNEQQPESAGLAPAICMSRYLGLPQRVRASLSRPAAVPSKQLAPHGRRRGCHTLLRERDLLCLLSQPGLPGLQTMWLYSGPFTAGQ